MMMKLHFSSNKKNNLPPIVEGAISKPSISRRVVDNGSSNSVRLNRKSVSLIIPQKQENKSKMKKNLSAHSMPSPNYYNSIVLPPIDDFMDHQNSELKFISQNSHNELNWDILQKSASNLSLKLDQLENENYNRDKIYEKTIHNLNQFVLQRTGILIVLLFNHTYIA
jgi:hypothetical protein